MQAYRFETKLTEDNTLVLQSLPFQAGEQVEVIILAKQPLADPDPYPLRGLPVTYVDPTEPVAQAEWAVNQ